MSDEGITKKIEKHDWSRFDALTDAEVHAAALADPDAQPLTEERLARMKRVPRAKTLRRALGLTQEEFAARYQIPIGTLSDWEQGISEPDQPARAYLKVIARDPEGVHRALEAKPGREMGEITWPWRLSHFRGPALERLSPLERDMATILEVLHQLDQGRPGEHLVIDRDEADRVRGFHGEDEAGNVTWRYAKDEGGEETWLPPEQSGGTE
jgi:putative transcriptional regulator